MKSNTQCCNLGKDESNLLLKLQMDVQAGSTIYTGHAHRRKKGYGGLWIWLGNVKMFTIINLSESQATMYQDDNQAHHIRTA